MIIHIWTLFSQNIVRFKHHTYTLLVVFLILGVFYFANLRCGKCELWSCDTVRAQALWGEHWLKKCQTEKYLPKKKKKDLNKPCYKTMMEVYRTASAQPRRRVERSLCVLTTGPCARELMLTSRPQINQDIYSSLWCSTLVFYVNIPVI